MHLVYIDETGNTGKNLNDAQQPVFLLCAMLIHKDNWQGLEKALQGICDDHFGKKAATDAFEIHATEIRNGKGIFKGMPVGERIAFRDQLLRAAFDSNAKIIYRSINKSKFKAWVIDSFGTGVSINPHVVAFPLIAQVVNQYLQEKDTLGIFISDENKEIIADVEKSIKLLRGATSTLRLDRIIEKGFFIDSRKSLALQLCDLCAYSLRKKEERLLGLEPKTIDDSGIELVDRITHIGDEPWHDVIEWIKKGAARE